MMDDLLPSDITANSENSFHPAKDEDNGDVNKEEDGGNSGKDLNEHKHNVSKL